MTKPYIMAVGLLGLVLLSACATPAPVAGPLAAPVTNTSANTASRNTARGVVAAVRACSSANLGVGAVLSALHKPLPDVAVQRDEIVIREHDGSALSTIPDGQAPVLQPGDHVLVVAKDGTNLVRQN